MRYRLLGKTGLKISEMGLGTAQLGGPSIIAGRLSGFKQIPYNEAVSIVIESLENGINFFDTSDMYGNGRAETILGEVCRSCRENVYIATKCGLTKSGERCFEKDYILSHIKSSLKRLNTGYVDIFQLTKPPLEIINNGKIFDIFNLIKSEGLALFCGISVGTVKEGFAAVNSNMDVIQVLYNMIDQSAEDLIKYAASKDVGVIVRSPLSTGILTGKFNKNTKFEDFDDRKKYLDDKEFSRRLAMVENIIQKHEIQACELTKLAIKFLLKNKNISTIIPGASSIEQLRQNIAIVNSL